MRYLDRLGRLVWIYRACGMAKDQIALLNREINAAMKLPEVRDKMVRFGLEIHTEPPEFFTQTLRSDFENGVSWRDP